MRKRIESPARVLIIDDSADTTEVLCYVVGGEPDLECVGGLHTAENLTEEIRTRRPHIVVLDARMPGKDPLAAVQEFAAEFAGVRTIFYSGYDDPDFIDRVIDAGAWGFVSKDKDPDAIVRAIRSVAAGHVVFPRHSPRPLGTDSGSDLKPGTAAGSE